MSTQSVSLAFVGDLMLGRRVNEVAAQLPAESFWGDLLPLLRGCDAVFANLECPITTQDRRWRRCWKAFRFRAHPRVIDILKAGNVRFVSLANNHILDCETEGLLDTMRHLDSAGIAHAGAGADLAEAARPRLVDVGGTRVGVISITDTMAEFAASPARAGTHFLPIRTDTKTLGRLARTVDETRRAGADLVVVSVHWGVNLRPRPSARFRRFARAVVDLGVDVFHGHSAHLVHGVEMHRGRLILYDTGDFLNDYWVFPMVRTDRSCLFLVDFLDARVRRVRMVPVLLDRARVRRAVGTEARKIAAHMLHTSLSYAGGDPGLAAEVHLMKAAGESAPAAIPVARYREAPPIWAPSLAPRPIRPAALENSAQANGASPATPL